MKKLLSCIVLAGLIFTQAFAQEAKKSNTGMWLPLKVGELNIEDMKALGLELDAAEVYNEDSPSIKDAVVRMGGGFCTGEFISGEGLILTNHHCGYDAIAELSSEEHDYLTDGFWAMNRGEELPVDGLTISLLVSSKDVTGDVAGAGDNKQAVIQGLEDEASENGKYEATVKSMFHGSEYYLFVYKTYRDVRLVGAPPSSIGKYGGDTDNWMWPRHTGDFSMFRVYADANNEPADYSDANVPFTPKHFFPISTNGVEKDDYSMVLGYPGTTTRYLTSSDINLALDQTNGDRIKLMGQKLETMKKAMKADDAVRIELASDYASTSNYWKYLIGQTTMLKRYDIPALKASEEDKFQRWADATTARKNKYGHVLADMAELNADHVATDRIMSYFNFAALAPSGMLNGLGYYRMLLGADEDDKESVPKMASAMKDQIESGWEGFYYEMDKEIFKKAFTSLLEDIPADQLPEVANAILTHKKAKKGKTIAEKVSRWADYAYDKSIVTNRELADDFFAKPSLKTLENDLLVSLVTGTIKHYRSEIAMKTGMFGQKMGALRKAYLQGLREMHDDKHYYPDANSTMRVTYGTVVPYEPKDGVYYDFKTSLDGVFEKEDPTSDEFTVPGKLKELWKEKDYGNYADKDGNLPVNFLSTNDITGGNSGSPVLNSKGELIGCAFDGNWEAMASDIHVFPEVTRTISVDARYILFIVDKFAGASHLLEEMNIVGETR